MTVIEVNESLRVIDADPSTPLLFVLRNELGLTGAKLGCGLEQCFACAIIADGHVVPSCSTPVGQFDGCRITTVEGLGTADQLHPVQRAFVDEGAAQCGYCIPAIVLRVACLLASEPSPSEPQIRAALEPHLCRCGAHPRILAAARRAARYADADSPA